MSTIHRIGFGGGCHWCTEAVFNSIIGAEKVESGWIASGSPNDTFSEAVIVHYNPATIQLQDLIAIHLNTHQSTSDHSMRSKYRSAIYHFDHDEPILEYIQKLQKNFDKPLITQVLPFEKFKATGEAYHNYYYSNPQKPFCETYINPKLNKLMTKFKKHAAVSKIKG